MKEVSNRYSLFLALAVSVGSIGSVSVVGCETETSDVKNRSLEEEIAVAVNDVKEEKVKLKEPTLTAPNHPPLDEKIEESKGGGDTVKEAKEIGIINVQYSFHEDQLAEQFYKTAGLDYETLSYGLTKGKLPTFGSEDEYTLEMSHQENESEMLTTGEAKETHSKMQYAKMLGTSSDISFEEKRKFDWWIKCNPSLFGLFMADALTRDIDYSAM